MEENKNIMQEEEVNTTDLVPAEEYDEKSSGGGVGIGMAIGAGLTLAGIAIGKKLRKLWDAHKAKKDEIIEDAAPIMEATDSNEEDSSENDQKE